MSGIRFLIVVIFSFYACSMLNAQEKVKESSKKKPPEWILQPQTNYIITVGNGLTLQEAQSKAVDSAKNSILQIAVNSMLTDNSYFKSVGTTSAAAAVIFAKAPFYTDFNETIAEDYYWEYKVDKKNKTESYTYYLKYFPDAAKLKEIINGLAYIELTASLDSADAQLKACASIDDYNKVWRKLMFINSQFPDDFKQKQTCDALLKNIEAVFNSIEIKEMMNIPGKLVVTQTLHEKSINSTIPPVVNSKCIKVLNIEKMNYRWIITYDFSRCSGKPADSINIEFNNSYNTISQRFPVDLNREIIDVKMSDTDVLIAKNSTITFYVSSLYRKNVILTRVVFRFNDINFTDTKLNQLLDGAGLFDITFNLPPDFYTVKVDDYIRGELYYKSEKTGQEEVYRFYHKKVQRK